MSELHFSDTPSETAGTGLKALGLAVALLALALHINLALAIINQPLDAGLAKSSERAPTWWLFNDSVHRYGPGADFMALYHAGVASEQGVSLYAEIENPRHTPYYYPFRYLPILAQTVGEGSLSLLPLDAYKFWGLFLLGAGLCGCALLAQAAKSNGERLFAVVLFAFNTPLLLEYHMGQFTFLTVLLAAGAALWSEHLDRNPAPSGRRSFGRLGVGALFCLSVLIKLFTICAVPLWFKRRRFWLAACALLLPVVLNLSYFLEKPEEFTQFWSMNMSTPGGGLDAGNFSPLYFLFLVARGLGATFKDADFMHATSFVHSIFLAITLFVVFFSREKSLFAGLTALLLAHFASYVHFWEHHASAVFFLGLLFWLLRSQLSAKPERWVSALMLVSLILLALPSPSALFDASFNVYEQDPSRTWSLGAKLLVAGTKALPLLVLWAIALRCHWRAGLSFRIFLKERREPPICSPS